MSPGVDAGASPSSRAEAKDCTVSRVLTGTEITLEARLAGP